MKLSLRTPMRQLLLLLFFGLQLAWMVPQIQSVVVKDSLCSVLGCECSVVNRLDCRLRHIQELNGTGHYALAADTRILDLSRNAISRLDVCPGWPGSEAIQSLDVSRNAVQQIADCFFSSASSPWLSLVTLDLSRNQLTYLSDSVLQRLASLQSLDLSFNHLIRLHPDAFHNLAQLQRLDVSHNPIGPLLADNLLATLTNLAYLNLANCSISSMPLDLLRNNQQLTDLSLAWNPLPMVPNTLLYPTKEHLHFLDLTHTAIREIQDRDFQGLAQLRHLLLNDLPHLERIQNWGFSGLDHLEQLQCRQNPRLVTIQPLAFFHFAETDAGSLLRLNVSEVYLNSNGLNSIPDQLLDWSRMRRVQLDGNPWHCDCQLRWWSQELRLDLAPGIEFNEYLVCESPQRLKKLPVTQLTERDFCPAAALSWKRLAQVLMMVGMLLATIVMAIIVYRFCFKKYCPLFSLDTGNSFPGAQTNLSRMTTRLVSGDWRFWRTPIAVPDEVKYAKMRRSSSSDSWLPAAPS